MERGKGKKKKRRKRRGAEGKEGERQIQRESDSHTHQTSVHNTKYIQMKNATYYLINKCILLSDISYYLIYKYPPITFIYGSQGFNEPSKFYQ